MYDRINELMSHGQWEEAAFACESALQLYPFNGKLHGYKGMCHYRLNDYEKAEKEFLAAYSLDPTLGEAAVKRAQCLEKLRRYHEAMDVVKDWRPLRPNDHVLEGLEEFLKMKHEAEEHDAWERTRHVSLKIEITHLDQ